MDIYIDSGAHVSDIRDRKNTIEKELGEPNIIFYEGDSSEHSIHWPNPIVLAAYPLIYGVFWFAASLRYGGSRLLYLVRTDIGQDADLVSQLKNEYNINSIELDLDLREFLNRQWIAWVLLNWAFLIATIVLIAMRSYARGVVTFLLPFVIFAIVLQEPRNKHMAMTVNLYKPEFDRACLVMGEAHHNPVGSMLDGEEGITVINPACDPGLLWGIYYKFIDGLSILFWRVVRWTT